MSNERTVSDAYCKISGWFLGAVFCYQASLLLFLAEGLNLSATQIGVVLGVEMCMQFVLEVPSGLVADEIGGGRTARWALGFSILGSSLYLLLYLAYQRWPWQLDQPVAFCVLCSLIVALGASLYSSSLERWVDESTDRLKIDRQETRAKSWTQIGQLLGGLVGFLCLALADREPHVRQWMFAGPWLASLLVQAGVLLRYWALLGGRPPPASRTTGAARGSLVSRLVQRTRVSSLLRLHPATDSDFLHRMSAHAVLHAAICVVNIHFCVFLIDVFRAGDSAKAVASTNSYILLAGAWAGAYFLGVVGSLRTAEIVDLSATPRRYREYLVVFIFGFVGLAAFNQPAQASLVAALMLFPLCRYVEGQVRVMQAAVSRTHIKERWRDEEGAFLSLEAWVRSIVGAVTLLAVSVAREFGGWPASWGVSAVALCIPLLLLWLLHRHALLALLSWALAATFLTLSLSASRPSAEVVGLGQFRLNESSGSDPVEFGFLVTVDVGSEGPGSLLVRSSEPLFGFRSLDEWLKFGGARPSAELRYCDFVPGSLRDTHACHYDVGRPADDAAGFGSPPGLDDGRRAQVVVMSYRPLADFSHLALLWCPQPDEHSCQSEQDYEEIEVRHGWVQHTTLPRGIIVFAALLGWLFALRMYLRSPSTVRHVTLETSGPHAGE